MNKTMEHMAYALPLVSFDLIETRVSAGEPAIYLPSGDAVAFASVWESLLNDREQCAQLASRARSRGVDELDWRPRAAKYLGAWKGVLDRPGDKASAAETLPKRSFNHKVIGEVAAAGQIVDGGLAGA